MTIKKNDNHNVDTNITMKDNNDHDNDNNVPSSSEESSLQICSLSELKIDLTEEIRTNLSKQYNNVNDDDDDDDDNDVVGQILQAMKRPPAMTICRVNKFLATREEVMATLRERLDENTVNVSEHDIFDDVVVISAADTAPTAAAASTTSATASTSIPSLPPLYFSSIPPTEQTTNATTDNGNGNETTTTTTTTTTTSATKSLFDSWPTRKQKGWPMTHRVIVCDRFCAEAVLRGSDIFVKGVICADSGIRSKETVAVYADIPPTKNNNNNNKNKNGKNNKSKNNNKNSIPLTRGLVLDKYDHNRRCVFLGLGVTACSRQDMFRQSHGVGIRMCQDYKSRVGPGLPPLSGILTNKIQLQNLPSVLVGHLLNPQPHDVILDMCCAPGGKSAHLASLVLNKAIIVSCDKSRKKMVTAKAMFEQLGAMDCITPLALDSTKCCLEQKQQHSGDVMKSVADIIRDAPIKEKDGLKDIKGFFPESFDRILLDPPCSALGLRPKLFIPQQAWRELEKFAEYQKKFVQQAVRLLKPGGYLTYSTCTINALENECMVAYILSEFPMVELLPIEVSIGQPGLKGHGLTDEQRGKVRRFDPHTEDADTMGFFVALFQKKELKRKRTDGE